MLRKIIDFYRLSAPKAALVKSHDRRFSRLQWSTFLAATLGYGLYYVCRLSLNVVKKPIVDEGVFSEIELGIIGSVLFFTYAVGKFCNGFLADRSNIRRFMTTGLLISALVNLCLGFTNSFILFLILWGVNGWVQSMGAAPCVVGLSRWFPTSKRGSFYGFWSASHNLGEAFTFIAVASLVIALSLFLLVPDHHFWLDALAMVLFGLGIGVLICFLGGLMAIDIAPKKASGAALGVVGIASYLGAALQDIMNGVLIERNKTVVDGIDVYDFTAVSYFWIGAALLSVLLTLCVWNARRYN